MPELKIHWKSPTQPTSLSVNDVHVWGASLEVHPERQRLLETLLSEEETARARRFHFARDQGHFITGRGMLRRLLATYTQIEAAELEFAYGPKGKPFLKNTGSDNPLHFNVTHCEGLQVVAITQIGPVGVDVEKIRPMGDLKELMNGYFSPPTAEVLLALPDPEKTTAFFNLWTRHEACIKATGEGLAEGEHTFEVSFLPHEPVQVKKAKGGWSLRTLIPADNYTAAVAVESPEMNISCWQWRH